MNHAGSLAFGLVSAAGLLAIALAMTWFFLEHARQKLDDWRAMGWLLWWIVIVVCFFGAGMVLSDVVRRFKGPIL